jgi:hypothetical protein
MATSPTTGSPEFDMFLRLWDKGKMSATLARELLKINFAPEDDERMHELARKNQDGEITPDELRELDAHVRIGILVSILQSRARQVLKTKADAKKKVSVRPARG